MVFRRLTPNIEEKLLKKGVKLWNREAENASLRKRMHPFRVHRTKFAQKDRNVLSLPEDFTGRDLKRAKKLMKNRKKK